MLTLTLPWIWRHPLARRQLLRAYGRYAWWQLRCRVRRRPHRLRWVNGAVLILAPAMTGASGNLYAGLHEWPDMAFLLHLLRPRDTFLDVGSNVGSYTVLAAAAIGARALAVEPSSLALVGLRANIEANGLHGRVAVVQACIGAQTGDVRFSLDRGPENSVLADDDVLTAAERVPLLPLDDLPGADQACCWKLDVEGYETDVLKGASGLLARPQVQVILAEDRSPEVLQRLQAAGFVSCAYNPWTRRLSPDQCSEGGNLIWIRDIAWAEQRLCTAPPFQVCGLQI